MKTTTLLGLVLLPLGLMGCARNSVLLRDLANEDQAARQGGNVSHEGRSDDERRRLVIEQLAQGRVRTPADKTHAALVLQHTGAMFCDGRLISQDPENYLLAYHLARSAFEDGYRPAGWLVAATYDRYLSFTQGRQKYGTNRVLNPATDRMELPHIDRATTDEERARYGVPPLATILARGPEAPEPDSTKQ